MIQLNTDTIKVKENGQWSNLSSLTGPQGERGAKGETGAQGPQGIQGEPGYPTIETGDAGKVLTVNSSETSPEWASIIQGINIVKNIDLSNSPVVWTQAEMDALKPGDAVIEINSHKLYICFWKDTYDIKFFTGSIDVNNSDFNVFQDGLILYKDSGEMWQNSWGGDVLYKDLWSTMETESVGTVYMSIPSAGSIKEADESDPTNWWVNPVKEYVIVKKPQTAGTYTLQMTCDGNGNYTYAWV